MFKGILITKDEAGYKAALQTIDPTVLPEGDVTVRVDWSTVNYKDGLAITGKSPVVRRFPMVPGIDFAGTVIESSNPTWQPGDKVFHTILTHLENGVPIQYEDRYVNPAAAPDYIGLDFTQTTPTHHLLAHAPLTEASYSIEACLPTAVEAKALGIKRTEPCLAMMRCTVSGAHVASVARLVYPGTRYSFAGQFQA